MPIEVIGQFRTPTQVPWSRVAVVPQSCCTGEWAVPLPQILLEHWAVLQEKGSGCSPCLASAAQTCWQPGQPSGAVDALRQHSAPQTCPGSQKVSGNLTTGLGFFSFSLPFFSWPVGMKSKMEVAKVGGENFTGLLFLLLSLQELRIVCSRKKTRDRDAQGWIFK